MRMGQGALTLLSPRTLLHEMVGLKNVLAG